MYLFFSNFFWTSLGLYFWISFTKKKLQLRKNQSILRSQSLAFGTSIKLLFNLLANLTTEFFFYLSLLKTKWRHQNFHSIVLFSLFITFLVPSSDFTNLDMIPYDNVLLFVCYFTLLSSASSSNSNITKDNFNDK